MKALAGRKYKKKYWENGKKRKKVKKTGTGRRKNMKKVWDILNTGWTGIIFYCFLGILVAFSVHQASGLILNTELPIVTVSSKSMVPTLNVGDIVIIKGQETYELGDIIVFAGWETEPIIHRAVAIGNYPDVEKLEGWNELTDKYIGEMAYGKGKIYITKGDNNLRCDQCAGRFPVEEKRVYGKAVGRIPYLGWVKILAVEWFIRDPVLGIAILIILGVTYSIYKKIR